MSSCSLLNLPQDIHRSIALFLHPNELKELECTNKYFAKVTAEQFTQTEVQENALFSAHKHLCKIYPQLDRQSFITLVSHYDGIVLSQGRLIEKIEHFVESLQRNEQAEVIVNLLQYPGALIRTDFRTYDWLSKKICCSNNNEPLPIKTCHLLFGGMLKDDDELSIPSERIVALSGYTKDYVDENIVFPAFFERLPNISRMNTRCWFSYKIVTRIQLHPTNEKINRSQKIIMNEIRAHFIMRGDTLELPYNIAWTLVGVVTLAMLIYLSTRENVKKLDLLERIKRIDEDGHTIFSLMIVASITGVTAWATLFRDDTPLLPN